MINALTFSAPHKECAAANLVVKKPVPERPTEAAVQQNFYQYVGADFQEFFLNKIYLSSLEAGDKTIDACIGHVLGAGAKIMIDAARTLEEVGRFDVKYGVSPVFYLHRLGILQNASIAGGVYLDKDDVDLMVQENAGLILTPSFDAGRGHGIPPLKMYLDRGLKISLGTMDNSFNKTGSVLYEAELLRLLVNGSMCGEVLTDADIKKLARARQ